MSHRGTRCVCSIFVIILVCKINSPGFLELLPLNQEHRGFYLFLICSVLLHFFPKLLTTWSEMINFLSYAFESFPSLHLLIGQLSDPINLHGPTILPSPDNSTCTPFFSTLFLPLTSPAENLLHHLNAPFPLCSGGFWSELYKHNLIWCWKLLVNRIGVWLLSGSLRAHFAVLPYKASENRRLSCLGRRFSPKWHIWLPQWPPSAYHQILPHGRLKVVSPWFRSWN